MNMPRKKRNPTLSVVEQTIVDAANQLIANKRKISIQRVLNEVSKQDPTISRHIVRRVLVMAGIPYNTSHRGKTETVYIADFGNKESEISVYDIEDAIDLMCNIAKAYEIQDSRAQVERKVKRCILGDREKLFGKIISNDREFLKARLIASDGREFNLKD